MIEVTGNEKNDHVEDFYASFKTNLENNHNFPEDFLFKFIILNDGEKLSEIYKVFDDTNYSITTKESGNGKYISCSINCFVMDANQVISLYKEVSKIEGVILL